MLSHYKAVKSSPKIQRGFHLCQLLFAPRAGGVEAVRVTGEESWSDLGCPPFSVRRPDEDLK